MVHCIGYSTKTLPQSDPLQILPDYIVVQTSRYYTKRAYNLLILKLKNQMHSTVRVRPIQKFLMRTAEAKK